MWKAICSTSGTAYSLSHQKDQLTWFLSARYTCCAISEYESGCLSVCMWNTLCRLNRCDSGWWRYKLNSILNWLCQWASPGNVAIKVAAHHIKEKPTLVLDHSDGHFFKTMEWSMVFEKKPLKAMVFLRFFTIQPLMSIILSNLNHWYQWFFNGFLKSNHCHWINGFAVNHWGQWIFNGYWRKKRRCFSKIAIYDQKQLLWV